MKESEINFLLHEKKMLYEKFKSLCNDYDFQNAIRASDKSSVKTRISKIKKMIDELFDGGIQNDE